MKIGKWLLVSRKHRVFYLKLWFKFHVEVISGDPPQVGLFYHRFLDADAMVESLKSRPVGFC